MGCEMIYESLGTLVGADEAQVRSFFDLPSEWRKAPVWALFFAVLASFGAGVVIGAWTAPTVGEKKRLELTLRRMGTAGRAAPALGVGYRTVLRRMHEHGFPIQRGRPRLILGETHE